jgi:hypothetical protein
MMKEIDDFYSCLGRLEEAYQTEYSTPQQCLAINEARMGVETAVFKIEKLLIQLMAQKASHEGKVVGE